MSPSSNRYLNEVQSLIKNNPAVVLYFKNNSCSPCQVLREKLSTLLSSEFPQLKLSVVPASKHPEVTAHFSIYSSPMIVVFFDGMETYRNGVYVSTPEQRQAIARHYDLVFSK